jgi:uncharacterized protein YodC (DUF2158 family)
MQMPEQAEKQGQYKCHWVEKGKGHCERNKRMGFADDYGTPPKRPWVGLTDVEVGKYNNRLNGGDIAREVEAKLKELNK